MNFVIRMTTDSDLGGELIKTRRVHAGHQVDFSQNFLVRLKLGLMSTLVFCIIINLFFKLSQSWIGLYKVGQMPN